MKPSLSFSEYGRVKPDTHGIEPDRHSTGLGRGGADVLAEANRGEGYPFNVLHDTGEFLRIEVGINEGDNSAAVVAKLEAAIAKSKAAIAERERSIGTSMMSVIGGHHEVNTIDTTVLENDDACAVACEMSTLTKILEWVKNQKEQ